jgi:hypothetical protein
MMSGVEYDITKPVPMSVASGTALPLQTASAKNQRGFGYPPVSPSQWWIQKYGSLHLKFQVRSTLGCQHSPQ